MARTKDKDYSIKIHETKKLNFTNKINIHLVKIKENFQLKESTNLRECLNEFFSWAELWREEYKLNPLLSAKRKHLEKTCAYTAKLIKELEVAGPIIKKDLYKSSKSESIIFEPSWNKEDHTRLILDKNTKCFEKELIRKNSIFDTEKLIEKLEMFYALNQHALHSLEDSKGGRPKDPYPRRCVNYFVEFFLNESELNASCYKNELKSSYDGPLYKFLLEIKDLLKKLKINISISNSTIGEYAEEHLSLLKEKQLKLSN